MEKILLGGIDIGTTGCKLSVYDTDGNFIKNAYRSYEISRQGGNAELDAEEIYGCVLEIIREACEGITLAAVGVTSFGESFAALDENDRAVFPAILYTDPRGDAECRSLCDRLGEDYITDKTGVKPHTMYSLPKMMMLKNRFPEKFAKVKRILQMEDYIVYMLTGKAQIDYSLATRTMGFDIRNKCWCDEIFDAAGIDKGLLSVPVKSGTVAGKLKAELSQKLGVSEFTVVTGAQDQVSAAVGAGVIEPGKAMDGTGTVECIVPVFDKMPEGTDMAKSGYAIVPFVKEGTYVCYALSYTGGASVKWFRDNFAKDLVEKGNAYAALDKGCKSDPSGIFVLPHFSGAATPYMDIGSKAAIIGLTLEHTRSDLYKAVMEGVTYEMMCNIKRLASYGVVPDRLYATGGGAGSSVWLQIKADILNLPIVPLTAAEVGACGTCMLCGVALGIYENLEEAAKIFVKEGKPYYPDPVRREKYAKLFCAYEKIYPSVRPITEA